jgi:hypothetical protein
MTVEAWTTVLMEVTVSVIVEATADEQVSAPQPLASRLISTHLA